MIDDFISLFFPHYCYGCNRPLTRNESFLCIRCDYEMPKSDSHTNESNFILNKFAGKLIIEDALAYYTFLKGGRIQRVLHQLKYNNRPELGVYLGEKYGLMLKQHNYHQKYDLIIPVPLHRARQNTRGYNQSEQFAEGLSKAMGLQVNSKAIKRLIKTKSQTNKSRLERWQNVSRIFEVTNQKALKGKRLLVVDDIVTTGATLESCIIELLDAGCAYVGIAVIAAAK